jgi:hypothetical protein
VVKSHILTGIPMLSNRQAKGAKSFVTQVLNDLESKPAWKNAPAHVQQVAKDLRKYIQDNKRITGFIIDVSFALSTKPVFKKIPWKNFLRR